jgi:hypothetical protein
MSAAHDVDPRDARAERRAIRIAAAALVLVCAGALALQFRHIASTLPYPHHVDEPFVSGPAARTLVEGTLHPYNFNYPSLPKYLAAIGMAGGFLRSAARHEVREIGRLGNVGYPYYDTPRAMQGARQLFALLGALAMAATGYAAYLAVPGPAAIVLAPLLLVATPLFFSDSWRYLNVDIVGTFFVALTLAACLKGTREPSIYRSAFVPGVCAGFATGSKYTLALAIVPVLLAIALFVPAGRRLTTGLAALAAMVAAFVFVMPYSLLDIPGFLNGLAIEAAHYAGGHAGYEAEPGWAQLSYYLGHFAAEFGLVGSALAVVGAAALARADWKRALLLFSFPVALLALLSSQRVHFARNVLSLHPIVAMFAAWGLVWAYGWAWALLARRDWVSGRFAWPARLTLGAALAAAAIPPAHLADLVRDRTDSRTLVQAWVRDRLPPEWFIAAPSQLGLDTDAFLKATGRRVAVVNLRSARDEESLRRLFHDVPRPAVVLAPRWDADERFPGQEVAPLLNELTRSWRVVETFGANPVLVNYSQPVPSGNPAFAVAVIDR